MPDTNETALEKTFSDLAYSHLRDKSQGLLDYLVGFQMLKQEDDGRRAVGIFGFEVDEDFYYSPIFFLNGEIRGLDSLYSVKSDLFVPLTDDWVNTIINRRQQSLGSPDTSSRSERGTHVPDYSRLRIIPGGTGSINLKLAADTMMSQPDQLATVGTVDLTRELREAGLGRQFKAALDLNPVLRRRFEDFGYNTFDLVAGASPAKVAAEEKPVVIVNSITDEDVGDLTDDQRTQILEGGTVVIDRRPEITKSRAYKTESVEQLFNPGCGGLYDVLWSDGSVSPAAVVPDGSSTNRMMVYRDSDGKYGILPSQCVWALRQYSRDEFRDWLKERGGRPSDVRPQTVVAFFSTGGEGTGAFCVEEKRSGLDGITTLSSHCHNADVNSSIPLGGHGQRGNNGNPPHNAFQHLMFGGAGYSINAIPNVSQRPADPNCGVKVILVAETGAGSPHYVNEKLCVNDRRFYAIPLNEFSYETDGGFRYEEYDVKDWDAKLSYGDFGDCNTVKKAMDKVAEDLKVWRLGSETNIKIAETVHSVRGDGDGLRVLIGNYGLGEADARAILKEAGYTPKVFKLQRAPKTAAQLLEIPEAQDTTPGGMMSQFHDEQVPYRTTDTAISEDNTSFYQYESPFGGGGDAEGNTLQVVDQAAQTGQKEVFDAAALSSLIKSHNPTDLVDRFLPTVTSGMDRIGRMLFLIYWHYTDFEERYGEKDLAEFIDNLKAVFEQLGDVVIFAKKQTLSGDPEHYGMERMPTMED